MYRTMADALEAARDDDSVRAVVIEGEPGVFTAGNDIADFLEGAPAPGVAINDWPPFRFMEALSAFDKPVVAAVTGVAVGIGVTMLLHCDLVYIADDARLASPFVALGLVPEFASSLLLTQGELHAELMRTVGMAGAGSVNGRVGCSRDRLDLLDPRDPRDRSAR